MPQLSRRPPLRKKELLPCLPSVSTTAGVVRYKFGCEWTLPSRLLSSERGDLLQQTCRDD